MKYNNENVGATVAKMRKMHPELTEHKDDRSKSKYFYDFSLLESIPDEIKEKVKEKIIKSTSYTFGDSAAGSFPGKYQYYIDADIQRYSVYDSQGRRIYKIMEISGMRIAAYKWNIYGLVDDNALPEFTKEYGHLRKNTLSAVCDIEIV